MSQMDSGLKELMRRANEVKFDDPNLTVPKVQPKQSKVESTSSKGKQVTSESNVTVEDVTRITQRLR